MSPPYLQDAQRPPIGKIATAGERKYTWYVDRPREGPEVEANLGECIPAFNSRRIYTVCLSSSSLTII